MVAYLFEHSQQGDSQLARPEQRTAAKDYPHHGITKGEKHWFVRLKIGPRSSKELRQKTPFSRSQLTTSEYLSALYDWEDDLASFSDMDDAQDMADRIRTLGEEQQEKFDNMPEGLQQGDSGQTLEARAAACEAAAEAIEEIISEWESAKEEYDGEVEAWEAALKTIEESDDPEAVQKAYQHTEESERPDEDFDDSDFIDQMREVSVDG